MLVYGDPQYEEKLSVLLKALLTRLAVTRLDDLEALRILVIQAGQVEQGICDRWSTAREPSQQVLAGTVKLTDAAASAFYSAWAKASGAVAGPAAVSEATLRTTARDLAAIQLAEDPPLTIKIPEGFEFYALFPEQYCAAALKWAAAHTRTWPKRVVVAGIRSIGTTLSALVKAALAAAGWQVERFTVRPTGHPFDRRAEIGAVELGAAKCALVADEGPGISGSSMAAVARALAEAGCADISFLPVHDGEPGSAASGEVRRWWAETPRFLVRLEDLRWNRLSLAESLAARTSELYEAAEPFDRIEDLSAGMWRQIALEDETHWPAVCATFERMKFRCCSRSGAAVLWKFAGLGSGLSGNLLADSAFEQMARQAQENRTPAPLVIFRGFIAMPWVAGQRLRQSDGADPSVQARLGNYLVRAAGPPLPAAESEASIARLAAMLYWNTREGCGEPLAELTRGWEQAAREVNSGPAYGDGRMAPWEWVRTAAGQLLKTDCAGHELDHTLIGRQSFLWDLAGALVEWNLKVPTATHLIRPLQHAGMEVEPKALKFYQMAYAAFRMGMCSLGASQAENGAAEYKRLQRAREAYREDLECLILTPRT